MKITTSADDVLPLKTCTMARTEITAAIGAINAFFPDSASVARARQSSQSHQLSTPLVKLWLGQALQFP